VSVASSNGPSTSVFWLGIGDIALGRHVAPGAFISFHPFRALVCTSPMVFLLRSCFVGCLVGVRPGPLLLGLGPGSRGVGRVRAADCPACLSGTRWLISYPGTAQPSCRLPAGRVCSGRATGLPALSTLVAVASPPRHLARAAAPALVVCPACDGGPRSVTLALWHPVTLLARVGWVRILFAFVS